MTFWPWGANLGAKESKVLKIGSPLDSPPFVYEGDGKGIELEILATILAEMGYEAEWIHLPPKRLIEHLLKGQIDAAARMYETKAARFPLSQPYITFHNVAVTHDHEIKELTVKDLAKYEVIAFQNAKENLGAQYTAAVEKSPDYREIPDQVRQVHLLMKKRFAIIVLELRIFEYFMRTHYPNKKAKIFPIFEPLDYRTAFADKKLRDSFNAALNDPATSRKFSAIWERYVARKDLEK